MPRDRVRDSSGKLHGTLTSSGDAGSVINAAIANRDNGNEDIIVPDPGFDLDTETTIDIPNDEQGFGLLTDGMPTLVPTSSFPDGNPVIRKQAVADDKIYGLRLGGFYIDDQTNQRSRWGIELDDIKQSYVEPSVCFDTGGLHLMATNNYSNQNEIHGPFVKLNEGYHLSPGGIYCEAASGGDPTPDQNWFYSPTYNEASPTTTPETTAFQDEGKHNNWICTRCEWAGIVHDQSNQNYTIIEGGWDRADIGLTVVEREGAFGSIFALAGQNYDKLRIRSGGTHIANTGHRGFQGGNAQRTASSYVTHIFDSLTTNSAITDFPQFTTSGSGSVTTNNSFFVRPFLRFNVGAGESVDLTTGSNTLKSQGYPKLVMPFAPDTDPGDTTGVVARMGYRTDASNYVELVFDPDDTLSDGTISTTNWYLEVASGGSIDDQVDLGVAPTEPHSVALSRDEDGTTQKWSACAEDGLWVETTSDPGGTGEIHWYVESVDASAHTWQLDVDRRKPFFWTH